MYLDHRVTAKITRILEQIDMSALLMDSNGTVVLPEGDNRQLTLPDQLRREPTTPMVYGGVTLIGTDDRQPLYICLHGDSQEAKNCAVLCAELINMLVRVDLGHATREQAVRMMPARRSGRRGIGFPGGGAQHSSGEKPLCFVFLFFRNRHRRSFVRAGGGDRPRKRRAGGGRPPFPGADENPSTARSTTTNWSR